MSERDHLSIQEFSERSGLPVVTLRRYIRKGKIPFIQPGGRKHRILIPKNAFELLKPQPSSPVAESPRPSPTIPGPMPRWKRGG